MHDRVAVLSVVSCLLQDLRYLRQHANTRLRGYSVPFLLAMSTLRRALGIAAYGKIHCNNEKTPEAATSEVLEN